MYPQLTKDELTTKMAALNALQHMASTLRGNSTPGLTEKLDQLLEDANRKWKELEEGTMTRNEGNPPLGNAIEVNVVPL